MFGSIVHLKLKRLVFTLAFSISSGSYAQDSLQTKTEEKFHNLFLTAGYSTAFGAALGAAFLGLQPNPSKNLHYIAMGASIGFITGSAFGSYVVFAPVFNSSKGEQRNFPLDTTQNSPRLPLQYTGDTTSTAKSNILITPVFNPKKTNRIEELSLGYKINF
jgi:hypothetical protein